MGRGKLKESLESIRRENAAKMFLQNHTHHIQSCSLSQSDIRTLYDLDKSQYEIYINRVLDKQYHKTIDFTNKACIECILKVIFPTPYFTEYMKTHKDDTGGITDSEVLRVIGRSPLSE